MKTRLTRSPFLATALAIVLTCTNATAAPSTLKATNSDAAFGEAMQLYRQGHWSGAYGRFAALADQGHAEAARIALLMLRHGSKMYGHEWAASQPQIDQWMKLTLQRMDALVSESGD